MSVARVTEIISSSNKSFEDAIQQGPIQRSAASRYARHRRIRRSIRVSRNVGSAALALAYVANGRFDAFVQNGGLSPWDVAAAGLIAERILGEVEPDDRIGTDETNSPPL